MRSSSSDESYTLTPPRQMSLEQAVEYIAPDELVEITPKSLRLRKKILVHHLRKRAAIAEEKMLEGEEEA